MAVPVLMPRWGMIMEEGFIVSWMKPEGAIVEKGEILAEIESEKVTNELEAPESGVLGRIVVPEGETEKVGYIVAVIVSADETSADVDECIASFKKPDAGATAIDALSRPGDNETTTGTVPNGESDDSRVRCSPAARRIAKDSGLDWRSLQGSGPRGRIQVRDVKQAFTSSQAGRDLQPESPVIGNLSPLRKAVAGRTMKSIEIPQAALCREIDCTALVDARRRQKEQTGAAAHSFTTTILHSVARALTRVPILNGTYRGGTHVTSASVHLGIVVAVEEGVVVPVIHNADSMSEAQIDGALADLVNRANSHDLKHDEVSGSTFTVSNAGMLGVDFFQPLLNPPEVGGLGIGRTKRRPAAVGEKIEIRSTAYFCVTTDHRIVDAAPAGEFLTILDELLSER